MLWDLDQVPARGIEQVKEWYAGFPVKVWRPHVVRRSVGSGRRVRVWVERRPFDVEIIAKMRAAELPLFTRQVYDPQATTPSI